MLAWHCRYAKIIGAYPELTRPDLSILEIGSGSQGIALWLCRPVTCLDHFSDEETNPWITPVDGDAQALPFDDKSFDFVICADGFQGFSPAAREQSVHEFVRVARLRVLVLCPAGSSARDGDFFLERLHELHGAVPPGDLMESAGDGLPRMSELYSLMLRTGLKFTIDGNQGRLQHYSAVVMDEIFAPSRDWNIQHAYKTVMEAPIGAAAWDGFYDWLFDLDISGRRAPRRTWAQKSGPKRSAGSAAVYAVYHAEDPPPWLGRITPILAGGRFQPGGSGLTDRTESEAPLPNDRWSELSAIYKIWREGPRTDVVGFEHYRRLFYFKPGATQERLLVMELSKFEEHAGFLWDDEVISQVDDGTIILPPPHRFETNVFEQYVNSHNAGDWCRVLNIIMERHPEYLPYVAEQFEDEHAYINNLFIASWSFFDALCEHWFDIMKSFTDSVPAGRASAHQNRDVSFISERVFDILIRARQAEGTRVIHVPFVLLTSPAGPSHRTHEVLARVPYHGTAPWTGIESARAAPLGRAAAPTTRASRLRTLARTLLPSWALRPARHLYRWLRGVAGTKERTMSAK